MATATSTLFFNGTILTQNPKQPYSEAVFVQKDKILAVGRLESMKELISSQTHYVDLQGKTLMPGFIDAHIHLWKVGNLLTFTLDLRGSKSVDEILEKIKDFHLKNPDNSYINARGFNESNLLEQRMITKNDLDSLGIEKPIIVQRTCAHITVVNSFTLQKIENQGIVFEIDGGEVDLATGTLYETAQGLAQKILAPYSTAEYKTMLHAAYQALLKYGVTSACDPAVMPDLLEVYHQLHQEKQLPIRTNAIPVRLPDGGANTLPIPKRHRSPMLQVDTVKFFADGGLSGKTAALRRTYNDGISKGIMRLSAESFYLWAAEAQAREFRIATHAIGDEAIDLVLGVYEKLFEQFGIRNRIEHLGLPDAAQLKRIKKSKTYIVSQPVFLEELGKNFIQYLDESYLSICYPYKSILKAGIDLAFSTDAPVVKNLNPFQSIHNAVTRSTASGEIIAASEAINIHEALYAYTLGAAKSLQIDDWTGSIEAGKYADLIVLDKNPLKVKKDGLTQIKVLNVFINGEEKAIF
jgi:predicted amidohydrolase YtcJ